MPIDPGRSGHGRKVIWVSQDLGLLGRVVTHLPKSARTSKSKRPTMSVYNPIVFRSYRRNAGHTGNPAAVKTTLSVRALPVILVWIMGNPVQVAAIAQRVKRYQQGGPRGGFPGGTRRGLTVDLGEVHVQAQSGTMCAKGSY